MAEEFCAKYGVYDDEVFEDEDEDGREVFDNIEGQDVDRGVIEDPERLGEKWGEDGLSFT